MVVFFHLYSIKASYENEQISNIHPTAVAIIFNVDRVYVLELVQILWESLLISAAMPDWIFAVNTSHLIDSATSHKIDSRRQKMIRDQVFYEVQVIECDYKFVIKISF